MTSTTLYAPAQHHQDTSKDIGQVRADHLTDALSFRSGLRPDPDRDMVRELAGLPAGADSVSR